MSEKKVSIIVPAYNAEAYLPRSISSVAAQTYPHWELLIVDDGSSDGSIPLCQEWMQKDARIKLICNEHGGTALARNTALDVATGDYIAFLDADDAYHPQMLESMVSAMEQNGCDLSVCTTVRGTDATAFCSETVSPTYQKYTKEQIFDMMYNGRWPDMIAPYTKIYAKAIFDTVRFPSGRFFEDAATMNLAVYYSTSVCLTETPLYFYNITPNSSSVTKKSYELLDREWALRSHWEFYFAEGREDLAYMTLPFYMVELIMIYHRILGSDKPEDAALIRARFNDTYKKYGKKVRFTQEQSDSILQFCHPARYDIHMMLRRDGVWGTVKGFVKRKLGK